MEPDALDLDLDRVKVAQEYQIVYAVELDARGKLREGREPERVPGQYNIYDSVPGMARYSPLWQFNYVVVRGTTDPTRSGRRPTAHQRLPDQEKQDRRELTGSLSAAVRGSTSPVLSMAWRPVGEGSAAPSPYRCRPYP